MNRLNVIVAGCANPHIPGYLRGANQSDSLMRILAISDRSAQNINVAKMTVPDSNHVKFYDDEIEMFKAHPEADAIIIGSDNIHHFEMFRSAIKFHKHIYMMKVISMNEDECLEMIEMEKYYDKVIQSELELHFNPQFLHAKELVQSGILGKIQSIYLTNISQSPCNYFPNWGDPLLSYGKIIPIHPGSSIYRGGALTDHPHPFDLIRWITGREFATIKGVSAPNQRQHLKVEDHVAVIGRLDDETIYSINPSYTNLEEHVPARRLLWPKSLECNLKITGSKGYFACDYFDRHVYIVGKNFVSPDRLIVDLTPRLTVDPDCGLIPSFVAAIAGRRAKVETSLADSYAAIRVMNGAYESIYQGKTIHLTR